MARSSGKEKDKIEISQYILEKVPREAGVTRIEYEGPMLAVYTCLLYTSDAADE